MKNFPHITCILLIIGLTTFSSGQTTSTRSYYQPLGQLRFEPNFGQAGEDAAFVARQAGLNARFQRQAIDLYLPSSQNLSRLRMELHGSSSAQIIGEERIPGTTNYLRGNDPALWKTNIPGFSRLRYREIYAGIDLVFYGRAGELEHDFVVAPGADPAQINLELKGTKAIRTLRNGNLVVNTRSGSLTFKKPFAYQELGTERREIEVAFKLSGDHLGFKLGHYDPRLALVIDPILTFSTYFTGSSGHDTVYGVATDSSGNIYVTGQTASTDFPTHLPEQPACSGCPATDAFVAKLDPTGSTLIYSTYLGGTGNDAGHAIAVDASGNALVAGGTFSTDFPSVNAITPATCCNGAVFVASLSPNGASLNYSGVVGTAILDGKNDFGLSRDLVAIATDSAGNAYVSGVTNSSSFPITPGTLTTSVPPSPARTLFIFKVAPAGALVWSTVLPGTMTFGGNSMHNLGIAVDAGKNVFVTRSADPGLPTTPGVVGPTAPAFGAAFVARINPTASAFIYLTYLPGADNSSGITLDPDGNAYVAGITSGTGLQTSANAFQKTGKAGLEAYILKLNATGTAIPAATYFTGPNTTLGGQPAVLFSYIYGVVLDANRNVYVSGVTETTIPLKFPFQPDPASFSGYVSELSSDLSTVLFSTHLNGGDIRTNVFAGGFPSSMAVDPAGKLVMGGATQSPAFPAVNAFQSTAAKGGGYLVKIDTSVPAPSVCHDIDGTFFVSVPVNRTRAQRLNLTNCGNADLHVSSVSTTGPPFSATANCAAVVPGASCSVSIVFAPTAQVQSFGQLTINDDAPIPTQIFLLQGTGSFPQPPGFVIADAATGSTEIPVVTITAGATGVFNLSVVPDAGFSASASFNCSGAPPGGSCSLSPASFNLSGAPVPMVLSVTTTGARAATAPLKIHNDNALFYGVVLGLPVILLGKPRRRRMAAILVLLLLAFNAVSCGGGSGGGGGGSPTPPGNYSIIVNGVAGSAQASTSVQLTVQ